MSKQKFTHTRAFGGRAVTFEIDVDLDALALDRGQAAINAKTRKTTLCGGAIVARAVKIEEAAR